MKEDLINLFRWNTKVDIKDRDGNVSTTLYIRLVGDVDYSQAQQYGLVASRKLRKKLKNNNTAEYQALFLDIDDRNKDDLITGTLLAEVTNFRDAAMAELTETIVDTKLPSDASLEDREDQQEDEEEAIKNRAEKVRTRMEEKSEERRVELEKLSIKDIRKVFVESSINSRCMDEFILVFREYCVFSGTYSDSKFKQRTFSDFDSFRNISTDLKRQLMDAYVKLELSGEQLKN